LPFPGNQPGAETTGSVDRGEAGRPVIASYHLREDSPDTDRAALGWRNAYDRAGLVDAVVGGGGITAACGRARFLFNDLAKACGFEPFLANAAASEEVQTFIRGLKTAIDELRAAFPELQERLRKSLREAFDLPGSFQEFRSALARRSEQVVFGINEPKLRAFCLRLMDDNLPESEWLESLGSYLALKPPAKWHDAEEDLFVQELALLTTRFHRVESIVFVDGKQSRNGVGIRLAITQANGTEHEQVIHVAADEENRLRELQTEFEALLTKGKRLGLAAASRAIWSKLEKVEKAAP